MHQTKLFKRNIFPERTEYHRGRGRINDQLLYLIMIQLTIAPLLFGSNRPAFWFFWSVTLSLTSAWWFTKIGHADLSFNISLSRLIFLLILYILLVFYMLIQILPIGLFVPELPIMIDPEINASINTLSLAPGDTFLALVRWLSYGQLFFLTLQLSVNPARAARLLCFLFWSIVAHALLGLTLLYESNDTILGIAKWDHHGSATAGFTNRNSFATLLAFGSILGAVQIIQDYKHHHTLTVIQGRTALLYQSITGKLPTFVGWIIIIIALITTNSRMGILAACCGMIICMFLHASRLLAKLRIKIICIYIILSLFLTLLLTYLYGAKYIKRLEQLETGDINYRMTLYNQVINMIKQRPLTGFGGDSFEQAFPLFHQPDMDIDRVSQKAHSTYLALWTDYGLIFGSLPLIIVGYLLCKIMQSYMGRNYSEPTLLASTGIIIVGMLHALVDFSLEIEAVTFVFVAVAAAGLAQTYSRNLKQCSK